MFIQEPSSVHEGRVFVHIDILITNCSHTHTQAHTKAHTKVHPHMVIIGTPPHGILSV